MNIRRIKKTGMNIMFAIQNSHPPPKKPNKLLKPKSMNGKPGQSKNRTELIKIIFDMVHFISKRTEIIM